MCDKKNSVLFTDTECLVLSPLFKLPDENQVLLRVPRENNMYNVNLKNIVPSGDLTCLFAKATLDESNLWYRRLGHINFKTINKLVKDSLGKFDGKVDEGFLVGYSVSSKAIRVFNSRTRIVQETLHINFLENKPNVEGSGPTWLFDIDTLTKTMNYQPVTAGNQSNHNTSVQEYFDAGKAGEENIQQYVLFPVWSSGSTNPQNTDGDATFNEKEPEVERRKPESEANLSPSSSGQSKKHDDKTKREAKGKSPVESSSGYRNLSAEFEDFYDNSINEDNVAGTLVHAVGQISTNSTNTFSAAGPSNTAEDITYSDDEDDVGAEADFTNLETTITVSPIPTTRVHKDHLVTQIIGDLSSATQTRSMTRVAKDQGHTQEEGIDYEEVFAPVARIEAIRLFLAFASFMGFMVYQMDVKSAFLYGTIKEEVYVCQPLGFEDPDYLDKVYKVVKALYGLHQAPRAWQKGDILLVQIYVDDIIFGFTNKDLYKVIEKLMKDKFQMSSMGKLTFFLGLQVKQKKDGIFISQDKYVAEILRKFGLTDRKSASTPIDTKKPLIKDPDGEDVDVRTYRSMIGSLMYLTSSRPDIMFAFLGCRLISWKCKKQTVVATSSTEAEYIDAGSCCAQVLWIQNQLLDYGPDQMVCGKDSLNPLMADNLPKIVSYSPHHVALMKSWLVQKQTAFGQTTTGKEISNPFLAGSLPKTMLITFINFKFSLFGLTNWCCSLNAVRSQIKKVNDVSRLQALVDRKKVIITESTIRDALRLDDAEGTECLPDEEFFTELARMGYEKPLTKLTFYKAFFSSQWKFLIHTIL
nr:putative ribonuclease H-like domain-containing protein [Tanacetum cinerariifolium]